MVHLWQGDVAHEHMCATCIKRAAMVVAAAAAAAVVEVVVVAEVEKVATAHQILPTSVENDVSSPEGINMLT